MLFKNAILHTMEADTFLGDFRIEEGKFVEIGLNLEAAGLEEVIDLECLHVFPGMVDAHTHLGMEETAIGWAGMDLNEGSHACTPNIRGIDGCNPMDEAVGVALKAGITSVAAGPGSGNVIGGTFFAYKTYGYCIDEMVIQNPIAMKAAFGENPRRFHERSGGESQIITRMKVAALLRETLAKTKEYLAKKEAAEGDLFKMPPYDQKLEAMIPVVKKEMPLKTHAHRADDILTAIRIAKEFDIDMTLDHCTDGRAIVKQVKESGFPALLGPSLGAKTKFECKNKSFETPKVLSDAGVLCCIITDAPFDPIELLPVSAAMAVKSGLAEEEALKMITINPAKILRLDDRIGSIKAGKDADFIVCTGSLIELDNHILEVYVNGERVV